MAITAISKRDRLEPYLVRGVVVMAPRDASQEELESRYRQAVAEIKAERFRKLFGQARIPRKFEVATWEMFDENDPAVKAARKWAEGAGKPFLFLQGPVGTGKTTLGTVAFKERLQRELKPGLWREFMALILELQAGFQTGQYERLLEGVADAPILFLDDVGMAKATPWRQEVLFVLVNRRYNDGLPTIFTTNLTLPAFARTWGEPIMSRLHEAAELVHMAGKDLRRQMGGRRGGSR